MTFIKKIAPAHLLTLSFLFFSFKAGDANLQVFDLTTIHLSEIKAFNSDQTSVFGIMAGMRMEEVERMVSKTPGLMLKDDKLKEDRFYLYEKKNGMEGECLAYFVWKDAHPEMQRMVLYAGIHKYMPEHGTDLFSAATLDPHSFIYKNVLGKPDHKKVTLNVEDIDLRHTTYVYSSKKVEIVKQYYKGNTDYMLVMLN